MDKNSSKKFILIFSLFFLFGNRDVQAMRHLAYGVGTLATLTSVYFGYKYFNPKNPFKYNYERVCPKKTMGCAHAGTRCTFNFVNQEHLKNNIKYFENLKSDNERHDKALEYLKKTFCDSYQGFEPPEFIVILLDNIDPEQLNASKINELMVFCMLRADVTPMEMNQDLKYDDRPWEWGDSILFKCQIRKLIEITKRWHKKIDPKNCEPISFRHGEASTIYPQHMRKSEIANRSLFGKFLAFSILGLKHTPLANKSENLELIRELFEAYVEFFGKTTENFCCYEDLLTASKNFNLLKLVTEIFKEKIEPKNLELLLSEQVKKLDKNINDITNPPKKTRWSYRSPFSDLTNNLKLACYLETLLSEDQNEEESTLKKFRELKEKIKSLKKIKKFVTQKEKSIKEREQKIEHLTKKLLLVDELKKNPTIFDEMKRTSNQMLEHFNELKEKFEIKTTKFKKLKKQFWTDGLVTTDHLNKKEKIISNEIWELEEKLKKIEYDFSRNSKLQRLAENPKNFGADVERWEKEPWRIEFREYNLRNKEAGCEAQKKKLDLIKNL